MCFIAMAFARRRNPREPNASAGRETSADGWLKGRSSKYFGADNTTQSTFWTTG